jgi:hypothetical protein
MGMCANHQALRYEQIGRLQVHIIYTMDMGANSRYRSMRGNLLKRLTYGNEPGVPKTDENQFKAVGRLSSKTYPRTWWSSIMVTFVLIIFVAPPSVRVLLLAYFELVAQAHFTPPSFRSFLDDFNSRILLSLLTKTLVCPTLCIALIHTQFPRFQLFIASHTFAVLHHTLFISNWNDTTN